MLVYTTHQAVDFSDIACREVLIDRGRVTLC
jgi:hypothetical protein